MSDVGNERVALLLREYFQLVGDASFHLENSVLPVIDVGQLDRAPFHKYETPAGVTSVTATAGNVGHIGIRLPSDSRNRGALVVDSIHATTTVATRFQIWLVTSVLLGSSQNPPSWDARTLSGGAVLMRVGTSAQASGAAGEVQVAEYSALANETCRIPGPFVVRPDRTLIIQPTTMALKYEVGFHGRYWPDAK